MSKTYNIVVIGLGIMGRRMIQYMIPHDRFTVIGAWDPSAESVGSAKAEFPDVKIWDSAEAMIAAPEADLVYIASPPAFHKHYADLAMDAGKPVYCEKPLGISVPGERGNGPPSGRDEDAKRRQLLPGLARGCRDHRSRNEGRFHWGTSSAPSW